VHRSGSSNKNYNKGLRQELKEGAVVVGSTETLQHTTVTKGEEPTTAVIGYNQEGIPPDSQSTNLYYQRGANGAQVVPTNKEE
jgi:ribosomal protein L30E